ncbi:sulfotransferase [Saprospiraceae bacterium]|nr:sulfotransferase [Saprospiraceae bacterium]
MKLELLENQSEYIFITGIARSGTTLLGNVIGSAKDVVYEFEPPIINSLLATIPETKNDDLTISNWKLHFETFLYEDLFLGNLAGRRLNFNKNDDSYVGNRISQIEIDRRLERSFRRQDASGLTNKQIIAFKFPSYIHKVQQLSSLFPSMKIVIIFRDFIEVLNSLCKKKWLQNLESSLLWPFVKFKNCRIPHWVNPSQYQEFIDFSELERYAYYIKKENQALELLVNSDKISFVNYSDLIDKPGESIDSLFNEINLTKTSKTEELISSISRKTKSNDQLLEVLPKKIRFELLDIQKRIMLNHFN